MVAEAEQADIASPCHRKARSTPEPLGASLGSSLSSLYCGVASCNKILRAYHAVMNDGVVHNFIMPSIYLGLQACALDVPLDLYMKQVVLMVKVIGCAWHYVCLYSTIMSSKTKNYKV